MQEFTYEQKVKLKERIEKNVIDKKDWLYIIELLKKHNPDIYITKNNNGYFIDIVDLIQTTYYDLQNFINNLSKKNESLRETTEEDDVIDLPNKQIISPDNVCENVKIFRKYRKN